MNTSLVMYCCCEDVFGGSTGVNSLIFPSLFYYYYFFYKGAYFLLSRFGSWGVRRMVQGEVMYVLHRVHSAYFQTYIQQSYSL